jgi:outer membrane protein TolC
VLFAGCAIVAGCATVRPSPITADDVTASSARDRAAARIAPPIAGPLSLNEAIARALKYNLDQRVSVAEQMLATRQFDITKRDMLPSVMASAGYTTRDTDLTRRSIDSVTGGLSNANPFISQERSHLVTELGVTWNLLDFGVGYYNARQQANRILIADERRRKAVHTLIQDVQTAFWRAYSAQVLRSEILGTIRLAEDALVDAKQAETERLRAPLDALRFQRQILENLRTLEALDQELSTAKLDLARLINVPMDSDFALAEPSANFADEVLTVPVERLEELAIAGNADLREQHYNVRNAQLEARKAIMRLFPRLSFDYGFNYDTDKFLINNSWNEAGVQIAHNLLNIANIPLTRRLSQAGIALADQKRVATTMSIVSQVHISRQQYANARALYQRADALTDVEQRIMVQMANREQAAVQGKLETVTSKTSLIISLLRRYQALAQVYAAESRLQATLGLDPGVAKVDALALPDLTGAIGSVFADWRRSLVAAQPAPAAGRPVSAVPAAMPASNDTPEAETAVAPTPPAKGKVPTVQVGTFSSEARAKAALDAALKQLADARFTHVVEPVEVAGKLLYRAALAGADDRNVARAACTRLRAAGGTCVVRT